MEAIIEARPQEREKLKRRRRQERTFTSSDSINAGFGILLIAAYNMRLCGKKTRKNSSQLHGEFRTIFLWNFA